MFLEKYFIIFSLYDYIIVTNFKIMFNFLISEICFGITSAILLTTPPCFSITTVVGRHKITATIMIIRYRKIKYQRVHYILWRRSAEKKKTLPVIGFPSSTGTSIQTIVVPEARGIFYMVHGVRTDGKFLGGGGGGVWIRDQRGSGISRLL